MAKRLLVFSSGSGSGFENLVKYSRDAKASFKVVGLVTDKKDRPCLKRARRLGIPSLVLQSFGADVYREVVSYFNANHVQGSGWLKKFVGLDPKTTSNIHPGLLPRFGGLGMYGHHVHEAVMEAYRKGEIAHSAVTMHFVTEEYDQGPKVFEYPVYISPNDTAEILASRVNEYEHIFQPYITDLMLGGEISWDGKDPKSLKVPPFFSNDKALARLAYNSMNAKNKGHGGI